mgnify:CR=1 FL=1
MKNFARTLALVLTLFLSVTTPAFAALSESDAKYAQSASALTQEFTNAIGVWGDTYQAAPDKFGGKLCNFCDIQNPLWSFLYSC